MRSLTVRGVAVCLAVGAMVVTTTSCGGTAKRSDPAVLVPWTQVGDVRLGEPFKQVQAEYGREGSRGYRLHGGVLMAGSYVVGARVTVLYLTSRYYRTKSGFGVGSTFPRRWRHAFIYNPTLKESPCHCWVKIGSRKRSLPLRGAKFGIPWVIIDMSHGRVTDILMSSKYVD